jgi:hypothetical protein
MSNTDNFPPTVGEWYQQLPAWKKAAFRFLCLFDDVRAIEWCGYHRDINHAAKAAKEERKRQTIMPAYPKMPQVIPSPEETGGIDMSPEGVKKRATEFFRDRS